jgi:hypothetical protein
MMQAAVEARRLHNLFFSLNFESCSAEKLQLFTAKKDAVHPAVTSLLHLATSSNPKFRGANEG